MLTTKHTLKSKLKGKAKMKSTNNRQKQFGKLLIVDDEPDILENLTEILEPFCLEVKTASNGLDALAIVKSNEVDAVLTDIKMPKMTGLQFLAEIRSQLYRTPVVILTGHGDKKTMLEALRLDATDLLEKPFSIESVVETMSKALELGRAIRETDLAIDKIFNDSELPADEIARVKKMKKIAAAMKLGFSTYTNKDKAS